MNPRPWLPMLAAILLACQSPSAPHDTHAPAMRRAAVSEPTTAEKRGAIAAANWDAALDVRIELRDYGFAPSVLRLKVGQPYKLSVLNSGGVAHYFNAPEFLSTIAARQVTVKDQVEIIAPSFSAFEIARLGGTFTLEFVPLAKGDYRVFCHLRGEEHKGVAGTLIVE